MLILTAKRHEPIWIGEDICIFIADIRNKGNVRIAIEAPKHVRILRDEVKQRMKDDDGSGSST